ncbi:MAG: hypothetical protein J3K34DRAFT_519180 [Monoraphidium minutum]|nr:MAG: hypothetical protein J3K34DRAFT_519180 [Monoraphidium minutum]
MLQTTNGTRRASYAGGRAGSRSASCLRAGWRGGRPRGLVVEAGLGLPGAFGEATGGSGPNSWLVPTSLMARVTPTDAAAAPAPLTVYTIRLITSFDRGAALSDPAAGVNVCLVGADGRAVLHRVPPVNDPQEALSSMDDICGVVNEEVGANCVIAAAAPQQAWAPGKEPAPRPRFQEGARDEVSILAPELGPLAAVMVAPEGGSWALDEVNVSSSRTNHIDRFICRRQLGGRKGEGAVYLTPVPPDAVVYGSGDTARILTKEQAAALRSAGLSEYSDLKQRLLLATALLTAGGSGIAALASGAAAAVPFALGGCAGLVYQYLLQVGADSAVPPPAAGDAAAAQQPPTAASTAAAAAAAGPAPANGAADISWRGARQALGSGAFRVALLALAALSATSALVHQQAGAGAGGGAGGPEGASVAQLALGAPGAEAWQLGCAALGFLMYKVAILGVSMAPGGGPGPGGQAADVIELEGNRRKAS